MIVKQKLQNLLPAEKRKTIVLLANTSWYLANFRLKLASSLRDQGYRVVLISPQDAHTHFLLAQGFECIDWKLSRASNGLLLHARALWQLVSVYRAERPVAAHHFTLKGVFLGSIAAAGTGVPQVLNSITGLGHLFLHQSLPTRILRLSVTSTLRVLFWFVKPQMIFQNSDDRELYRSLKLGAQERSHEIPTSGIDLDFYRRSDEANAPPSSEPPVVLFAGRLLAEKGVREFVTAAYLLLSRGVRARFLLAGGRDPGNPSSISAQQISDWIAEGKLEFTGHLPDLRPLMEKSAIFVLPSYREGGSRVILEASAMGLPVVTTSVPGCQNLVDHERTGLLVPARDSVQLAAAIEKLLENPAERLRMGREGRKKISAEFSEEIVIRSTLAVYSSAGISMSEYSFRER